MNPDKRSATTKPGDLVVVNAHRLGEREQMGEVLEVFETSPSHYRVRWEDGHESLFFPGSDVTFRRGRFAR